jgi:hypothetical protein
MRNHYAWHGQPSIFTLPNLACAVCSNLLLQKSYLQTSKPRKGLNLK